MNPIEAAIRAEADKLIRRHQRYASGLSEEVVRRERRSGVPATKSIQKPSYWDASPGFNPYHVRSNASTIAYAMTRRLSAGTYAPRPAVVYRVPKADGSMREISVFQIADNAISRWLMKTLLAKNASRLSARCYSYRTDITIHDAVLHLASEVQATPRTFIAEFDFSKFFDAINHEHLERILSDKRFFYTPQERRLIWAFLHAGVSDLLTYCQSTPLQRECGIPQGTSISLFLANVAGYPLDHQLEKLGVGFVRYADDTVVWSDDYTKICNAASAIHQSASDMGVEVNLQKSEGISILANEGASVEFRGKTQVWFVGYSISKRVISIKGTSIRRIKERIAYHVYSNLLESIKQGHIVPARFAPRVDRDYVVMVTQIRRFLYGNLSETQLRRYIVGHVPRMQYRGLMSYYPIVDDEEMLRKLDGWMMHTVWTSLRKRTDLLTRAGYANLPEPHGLSKSQLIRFQGQTSGGANLDLRMPSFSRISKLLRRASVAYGPNAIAHPNSGQYYVV